VELILLMLRSKRLKIKLPFWISYGSLALFFIFLGIFLVHLLNSSINSILQPKAIEVGVFPDKPLQTGSISQVQRRKIKLDTQSSRFILRSGIPLLDQTSGEDDPFHLFHLNWAGIYWKLAANINQTTPQELLKAQIPLLAFVKPKMIVMPPAKKVQPIITPDKKPDITELDQQLPEIPLADQDPVVLIYHTHTSESYIPESGKSHTNNSKGDIVKVGAHLKKVLEEKYGIKTIHSDTIHDTYPFRESYQRSQVTLKKYLNEYPSIQVVLDIHRDATPGVNATCTINNEKATNILIVVGTDKMGLSHPNWKKNHHFASELTEAMNLYYPNLSSGIIVSKARYNQHLHERALILEFGDHQSELKEAYYAAELFAKILALKIKQGLNN